MRDQNINISSGLWLFLTAFLLIFYFPGTLKGAGIPSIEDVIEEKAQVPRIEELTDGKVKEGDLINKDNMDLVKEYLTPGVAEAIRQGMVLIMRPQLPVDKIVPKFFIELTKKNDGKAIIDENGTVYYEKMGTPWPGGCPFTRPKNALEAMANTKYGWVLDDVRQYPNILVFNSSDGKDYKTLYMDHLYVNCNCRHLVPPFGTYPGYEDVMFKRISVTTSPLALKGLGQFTVRHYDDAKKYDAGFAYLPAFKRTVRISATTWQDNIGGSDWTFGDGGILQEPYSDWDFKSATLKYMLMPEPDPPFPYIKKDATLDSRLQFDVGRKFGRLGWAIWPVYEVEAIPKIKHIYGKKVFYVNTWPYWPATWEINLSDSYDRQMKLWKVSWMCRAVLSYKDMSFVSTSSGPMHDLQTGHSSTFWFSQEVTELKPDDVTLTTLLQAGR
jgi:hypothetical protein